MVKTGEDKDRHCEKERQPFFFPSEIHCSGHEKATEHTAQESLHRSDGLTFDQQFRRRLNQVGDGISHTQRREQTSHDIEEQDEEEMSHVHPAFHGAGGAGIEFVLVMDNRDESKGEQHGTSHPAHREVDHTANGYA